MLKVRINRDIKVLSRFCEGSKGYEWVCVHGNFDEYGANVWEIWRRDFSWRKRSSWSKVAVCGSWAMMDMRWSQLTGQKISY